MHGLITYIRQHLSLRLGLLILTVVGSVFGVAFGYLFYQSKQYVQHVATVHAMEELDHTVGRISGIMDRAEGATAEMERTMVRHLEPDSLLAYSRLMLERYPEVYGFTIAMKSGYFPERGRFFSAYSLRRGDSIATVVEDRDYTELLWFKSPWERKRPLWLEPYIDDTPGFVTSSEYNFSYVKPLYDEEGKAVGVLCTDILLKWLSQVVTGIQSYPNSSAIMLGLDGRYIVHPDTAKLVRQTIFSDPDPQARNDVVSLGQSMLARQSGMWKMTVDGRPAHIFYRPLERTGWSIAIVCPDSDVFDGYDHTFYIVWVIIGLSLAVLLLFCYLIIRRAIVPVNRLSETARHIADGHFDESLPRSRRLDTVGQLQNSFSMMQQTLNSRMAQLRQMNETLTEQNRELQHAYQLVREADRRQTLFIQDMTHQVRTPLNIINGFTQVVTSIYTELPSNELNDIMERMRVSAKSIVRISRMLSALATDGLRPAGERGYVGCCSVCREAVAHFPNSAVVVEMHLPEEFTIFTERQAVVSILVELLDNAVRFTPQGVITLSCERCGDTMVAFTVSDTGPGIASADRDRIFTKFTKLNAFSEGIGLGLPLCRHTARQLGGDLVLDDGYTSGARFILTLPVNGKAAGG